MNQISFIYGIECLVLVGPATFAALLVVPGLLFVSLAGIFDGVIVSYFYAGAIFASVFGLAELWNLIVSTLLIKQYHIGWRYWLGLICGISGSIFIFRSNGPIVYFEFIGPVLLAALHFTLIQLMSSRYD